MAATTEVMESAEKAEAKSNVRRLSRVPRTAAEETEAEAEAAAPPAWDLDDPQVFLNRELTWLSFNQRVLAEAMDENVPLLERLKFMAIVAGNLDEFFMKRIGGLKQQVAAGILTRTPDGRTPQQQIFDCYARVTELEQAQRQLMPALLSQLDQSGIRIVRYEDLTAEQKESVRQHYFDNIFPLATPQAMDPAHPFPFVSNLSLNLLVTVRYPGDTDPSLARVKVPLGSGTQRFVRVGDERLYVTLEDVMSHNLDLLFPSMEIDSCEFFRVTRNANTERDEEQADDLLSMIESELLDRRFAPIVRLEVNQGMSAQHRGMLASELNLDERSDVFEVEGMMAMRNLMEIAMLDEPALRDPPHRPIDHARLQENRNIFHIIRDNGSILLQHPYESFTTSVERFLREASEDPKVRAIKMTLYRTSEDAKLVSYLAEAAMNGKQVAVVVELKARFDEATNINFAERLEEYGIHVTYGVVGLKTHCKVMLVVRQDYNGLRRYAHIGTGNYHPGTARLYTDLGLLTCDETIGEDLTELFNYLTTGYRPKRNYRKLLPAPTLLKKGIISRIEREIEHAANGETALVQMKMNGLEDIDITRALYRASQKGVKVELIVRDSCRLRPGLPGLSEHIRVVSIVGRFLEHGRIYYFRNAGQEEYLIGSADLMKRNLESRVEVVAPVDDPALQKELRSILDCQLGPNRDAWEMQPDGTYLKPTQDLVAKSGQYAMIEAAEKRHKGASRLRKRRPKGFARRSTQ